jgi:hypothetical protein
MKEQILGLIWGFEIPVCPLYTSGRSIKFPAEIFTHLMNANDYVFHEIPYGWKSRGAPHV